MINLYVFDVNKIKVDTSLVPSEFLSNSSKYNDEETKLLSTTSWYALYHILSKEYGILAESIELGENNKPFIKDNPIYFNISHSYPYIVIAVSDNEVGVDIESLENIERLKDNLGQIFKTKNAKKILKLWISNEAETKFRGEVLDYHNFKLEVSVHFYRNKFNKKYMICVKNTKNEKPSKIIYNFQFSL